MNKLHGLHEDVIEAIGRTIVWGEIAAGKALPNEPKLCGMLGVSRTALREAMRVLASKGLVEPKRKIGTQVRPAESWNNLDADILRWRLEAHDANRGAADADRVVDELYELRHLIEPVAASLAAQRAGASDIYALRCACEEMQAAGDDGEKIIAPDLKFHRAIIAASGNRLFSSLAHVIGAALTVNFELVRNAPRGHARSVPMHRKVLEAIEAQDPSAARVAMQRLIDDSQRDAKAVRESSKPRAQSARPHGDSGADTAGRRRR